MDHQETTMGERFNITSLLLGVATGIVATVLFATYDERRFKRVTRSTRAAGNRTGEYLSDFDDNLRERADDMVDSARNGVRKVGKSARHAVDSAARSAEDSADRLADSAHRAIGSKP
ncbi:MAG: YtxH domain-containing protein [Armatimonadetes bacterium]|nr:YtxH domain-containing protein [Armatimonadota bacterium]